MPQLSIIDLLRTMAAEPPNEPVYKEVLNNIALLGKQAWKEGLLVQRIYILPMFSIVRGDYEFVVIEYGNSVPKHEIMLSAIPNLPQYLLVHDWINFYEPTRK